MLREVAETGGGPARPPAGAGGGFSGAGGGFSGPGGGFSGPGGGFSGPGGGFSGPGDGCGPRYPQAEKAADWEFTYYHRGVLTHVLNRNVLANAQHAYALYWSTPESQWSQSWHLFKVLEETFRPAAP